MTIRNFYNSELAQASYLVACNASGEAIVIDPNRDIAPYLATAESLGVKITAVTETHIHADYLSGPRELANAAGAKLYLSDEGTEDWKYAFATEPNVTLVRDGDVISIGNLTFKVLHTPGHTPEHISFLLTDHPAGETPNSLFSGDFIFVGDVGRPDLLERAANVAGTMEAGARDLFRSLQGLKDLPDSLLIWPGHGAGSACGKALGGSPVTSLGYERQTNWAFAIRDENKFVDEVLSGQPEPPKYFAEMKRLNKLGPSILGAMPEPRFVAAPAGQIVDIRDEDVIRSDYKLGTLAIPYSRSFVTRAGWLLKYDADVTLIAEDQASANIAARDLALIGLDQVDVWVLPSALPTGEHLAASNEIEAGASVLDIRGSNERCASCVPGSMHIPMGYLPDRLNELPREGKLFVHCSSGFRSLTAMSILRSAGFGNVVEVQGGLDALQCATPEIVTTR